MTGTGTKIVKAKYIGSYVNDAPASPSSSTIEDIQIVWPEEDKQDDAEKYGYGDAAPSPRKVSHRMPRRSSLKSPNPVPRRASIGYTGEMVLRLPTGETKKKRTSISFDKKENTLEIEPLTDMIDNPDRLWFNDSELQYIKQDCIGLVEAIREQQGGRIDRSRTWRCTRGLEPLMFGISSATIESKESVFEEYNVQKLRGEYDEAHIREMYSFHTIDSQIQASERAEYDAREVETELRLSRKQYRRMSC